METVQENVKFDPSEILKLSERVMKICRLFAEDNIVVRFSENESSASFNVGNNVLTLPYNLKILSDDDICTTFISHEVGHAKYTKIEDILRIRDFQEKKGEILTGTHNIVEDIRIERLTKLRYPGLVGSYVRAYRKLADDGFFGPKKSWNALKFEDRLNIYAKCGPVTAKDIKFSEKEMDFYKRCMAAETSEDVFDLSVELLSIKTGRNDLSIKQLQEALESVFQNSIEHVINEDLVESDDVDIYDEGEDGGNSNPDSSYDDYEVEDIHYNTFDDLNDDQQLRVLARVHEAVENMNVTQEFQNKIDSFNLDGVLFHQYESIPKNKAKIFTAEDFVAHVKSYNVDTAESFIAETLKSMEKSVDYMARQFEMKKAAARYKNSKIAKSGAIDVNRIAQYKVTDEIFGKKVIIKDGKRHGMVILIDASGSMQGMFSKVVRQTMLLTEYARKIGVPFKVIMFGCHMYGGYLRERQNAVNYDSVHQIKFCMSSTSRWGNEPNDIIEVLNSDLDRKDYATAYLGLVSRIGFSLGGTPTTWAMGYAEHIAEEFFSKHNCNIRKLFVITDGEPSDTHYKSAKTVYVDKDTKTIVRDDGRVGRFSPIQAMFKIFKARYNIDCSSILLSSKMSSWEISSFIDPATKAGEDLLNNKTFWKENKYAKTVDHLGNTFMVLRPIVNVDSVSLDKINESTSVASATTAFRKALGSMKVSQTMLQALSDEFAA